MANPQLQPIEPAPTPAPEKPDYYEAMPADMKAQYDAASPEMQLRHRQAVAELRAMLRESEASGVSKRTYEEIWQSAVAKAKRDGLIDSVD